MGPHWEKKKKNLGNMEANTPIKNEPKMNLTDTSPKKIIQIASGPKNDAPHCRGVNV